MLFSEKLLFWTQFDISNSVKMFIFSLSDDESIKGAKTVVAIIRASLHWFVKGHPEIRKIHVRADNASCYHSASTIEGLFSLREEFRELGLEIMGFHFNEPGTK